MEGVMLIVWAVLLLITCVIGWLLNLVGMPGNWLNVAALALYAWLMPDDVRVSIGWPVVIAALVLALLGELIEFAAGAMGVAKVGGSRRGALLAIVGSLMGGLIGLFVGVPVPVVGQVIAALICASLGAMGGAYLGERWAGRTDAESWNVGNAAFWGRLFGTLGKVLVASVMLVVVLLGLLFKWA